MKYTTTVDAVQWFPGVEIEGVKPWKAEIRYSDCKTYFCIIHGCNRNDYCLDTNKIKGETPDFKKNGGLLSPRFICSEGKDGQMYHRRVYSFYYSIMVCKPQPISEDSDEYKDYAYANGWPEVTPPNAFLVVEDDIIGVVEPSDWIVTDQDGKKKVVKNEIFTSRYQQEK